MKYVVLIGDGMGDHRLEELGNKTILEAAETPNMDALASGGLLGLAQTVPESLSPGSDVANMAILGYDPENYHCGRGPLEAGSMGVKLLPNELAFRLNFVTLEHDGAKVIMRDHAAGHISTKDGHELIEFLSKNLAMDIGQKLHPGVSYRHLLTWPDLPDGLDTMPPHDYRDQEVTAYLQNREAGYKELMDLIKASWPLLESHPINVKRREEGKNPANSIWPWGQGKPPAMATYKERFGVGGAVVSAVDLIKGLGVYAGLTTPDVPGATGLVDTNYEGKTAAALKALETEDFALIHIEAPDEAGHQGDLEEKMEAVRRFDSRIVGPMWEALKKMGDFRLLILCDHFTPIPIKTHTREPVPFILYPNENGSGRNYTEAEAEAAGLFVPRAETLVDLLFG